VSQSAATADAEGISLLRLRCAAKRRRAFVFAPPRSGFTMRCYCEFSPRFSFAPASQMLPLSLRHCIIVFYCQPPPSSLISRHHYRFPDEAITPP